jgi:hypothetical protein
VRGSRNAWTPLALLLVGGSAFATDVKTLVATVERTARCPVPVHADVGSDRGPGFVLLAWHDVVRLELSDGTRVLARRAKAIAWSKGHLRRLDPTARPPGLPLAVEDLVPFDADRLRMPQISDESPAGVVVTAAPSRRSSHVLLVFTIDPERAVITKTQFYRDTINNMVALRRDGDFVTVAGRPRAHATTIEDLMDDATTHWRVSWRDAPELTPAAFTPAGLR